MNDRLKYRIFYDNKIVYPNSWNNIESIYECLKQQIMWDCKIDTDIKFNHIANNLIFMQSTGLKDKNGKLIYEGDIVRFKDNITINGSKIHKSVVEHNEKFNSFMYHAEYMGLFTINKAQNEKFDIEVIGNIYENKDLLNA